MSNGELAFLALVLMGFALFIVVVGFVSVWSRPARTSSTSTSAVAASGENAGARTAPRAKEGPTYTPRAA